MANLGLFVLSKVTTRSGSWQRFGHSSKSKMLHPPELDIAFSDENERAQSLATFLGTCVKLEMWRELALRPGSLSPDRTTLLSRTLEDGDTVELKLRRWATLFGDELEAVMESRNGVVHGLRLSDRELAGADWLADHLLRLIDPELSA
jgi:hypothetical protein